MQVTKRSPLTGDFNTLDLPVSQEQLDRIGHEKIQDIFPELSPGDREFLKSGYTQADWDAMFPPEPGSAEGDIPQ